MLEAFPDLNCTALARLLLIPDTGDLLVAADVVPSGEAGSGTLVLEGTMPHQRGNQLPVCPVIADT